MTELETAADLATVLRLGLIEVAAIHRSLAHRDGLKGAVYDYVTGKEFIEHVKSVVNCHFDLLEGLERQQRALERHWAAQRKQVRGSMSHVARMVGELQGLGAALPQLGTLELPPGP